MSKSIIELAGKRYEVRKSGNLREVLVEGKWIEHLAFVDMLQEAGELEQLCALAGLGAGVINQATDASAPVQKIECGRYENGKGAWMEIRDVQLPGYPGYDGGMTGVSAVWCGTSWFVVAKDEEHFWAQFPYSLLRGCFRPANS